MASEKILVETVSKLPEQIGAPAQEETTKAAVETVPVNLRREVVRFKSNISLKRNSRTGLASYLDWQTIPAILRFNILQQGKIILGTEAPGKSIQTNPSETKSDEVKIVPLG